MNFPAQHGSKNFLRGNLDAPAASPAISNGKIGWREKRNIASGPYRLTQSTNLLYPGIPSVATIFFPK